MMRCYYFTLLAALFVLAIGIPANPAPAAGSDDAFLGRWDITVPGQEGTPGRYCWLEVTREAGALKGRFNQGGGAVFPLPEVAIANGELTFQYPQGRPPDPSKAVYRAKIVNGKLEGTAVLGKGPPRPWTGVRGPVWPKTPPKRKPGKPVALFNGKDLSGWLPQFPQRPMGWSVKDGIMSNDSRANNIYSEQKFNDFKLEVEFNLDAKSNSGIYLRGRYEIQVLDGADRPLDVHSQGALYGFIVPSVKADKPAGEWQKFEITLLAGRVTVILNGTKIIDNAEVPGITGGALDANENEAGPIMIQGDHGRVQVRKVIVTPLM